MTRPIMSGAMARIEIAMLRNNCQKFICFRAKRRCGCMMPAMAIAKATYKRCGV